jgi:hypothetical protein
MAGEQYLLADAASVPGRGRCWAHQDEPDRRTSRVVYEVRDLGLWHRLEYETNFVHNRRPGLGLMYLSTVAVDVCRRTSSKYYDALSTEVVNRGRTGVLKMDGTRLGNMRCLFAVMNQAPGAACSHIWFRDLALVFI